MDKPALTAMLEAASDGVEDQRYCFSDAQEATLLVAVDGAVLNIERTRSVSVGEQFVVVDAERETVYLDSGSLFGVRVKARGPEGTGFIKS